MLFTYWHLVHFGLFSLFRSTSSIWFGSVYFSLLRSTSVQFSLLLSILVYLVHFSPIRFIRSTLVHSVNLVQFGSFGSLHSIKFTSVYFNPFGLFRSIWSTIVWYYLVNFSVIWSSTVHSIHFGPFQSTTVHWVNFGLILPIRSIRSISSMLVQFGSVWSISSISVYSVYYSPLSPIWFIQSMSTQFGPVSLF